MSTPSERSRLRWRRKTGAASISAVREMAPSRCPWSSSARAIGTRQRAGYVAAAGARIRHYSGWWPTSAKLLGSSVRTRRPHPWWSRVRHCCRTGLKPADDLGILSCSPGRWPRSVTVAFHRNHSSRSPGARPRRREAICLRGLIACSPPLPGRIVRAQEFDCPALLTPIVRHIVTRRARVEPRCGAIRTDITASPGDLD